MTMLMSPTPTSERSTAESSPRSHSDLGGLIDSLLDSMKHAIVEIEQINFQTKLLSLNARIEAARAGGMVGAAFGIVAQEIQTLSMHTGNVTAKLSAESQRTILEIQAEVEHFSTQARGNRLSDLALTSVDLVDRNLYERSCDVRWWATDSSLVDALTLKTPEAYRYASERLGVILSAYTVYYDLVLCDLQGQIVANGRPGLYRSLGTNQSAAAWFTEALGTRSGDEFGFQSAHRSGLVNGERALVYSCGVRERGQASGKLLGVLGIVFNWEALGQTIADKMSVKDQHGEIQTRCLICDNDGIILADTDHLQFGHRLELPFLNDMLRQTKGFRISEIDGKPMCLAYAKAPGFETYTTGWHCLILQSLDA